MLDGHWLVSWPQRKELNTKTHSLNETKTEHLTKALSNSHSTSNTHQLTVFIMNKSVSDAPNKDEETYQLLEQLDHILKRPETYIGSNRPCHEVTQPSLSLYVDVSSVNVSRQCGFLTSRVSKARKSFEKRSPTCPASSRYSTRFSVRDNSTDSVPLTMVYLWNLVNAADNKQRDPTMTSIEVDINP